MSALSAASALLDDLDAVALAQGVGALRPPGGDDHVAGRRPAAQHAGQQRLAHLAGTEHGDSLGHERTSYPLVATERRKNARLAGRSAIRRTR